MLGIWLYSRFVFCVPDPPRRPTVCWLDMILTAQKTHCQWCHKTFLYHRIAIIRHCVLYVRWGFFSWKKSQLQGPFLYTLTYEAHHPETSLITQRAKSRGFCRESLGMVDPWWRESPEKFGLWVKRESTGRLRGNFCVDSPGIFRRFPAEFIRIFGGFIGDKTVADFKENPQRFSREIV